MQFLIYIKKLVSPWRETLRINLECVWVTGRGGGHWSRHRGWTTSRRKNISLSQALTQASGRAQRSCAEPVVKVRRAHTTKEQNAVTSTTPNMLLSNPCWTTFGLPPPHGVCWKQVVICVENHMWGCHRIPNEMWLIRFYPLIGVGSAIVLLFAVSLNAYLLCMCIFRVF